MRAYTVATTALALDVNTKWIDNVLSHHRIPGTVRSQRGVRRRIPPRSVFIIALARTLGIELSIPLHRAIEIAIDIESGDMKSGEDAEYPVSDFLTLRVHREQLRADVARRLDDAAEFAAVPRRGRRPRTDTSAPGV